MAIKCGPGRPKKPKNENRSESVIVKFTPSERELIELAVENLGTRLSPWVRKRLLEAAQRDAAVSGRGLNRKRR